MLKLINNFIAQAIATATAEALRRRREVRAVDQEAARARSRRARVNSGIFQMMVGKMLENNGDLTGLKFTLSTR